MDSESVNLCRSDAVSNPVSDRIVNKWMLTQTGKRPNQLRHRGGKSRLHADKNMKKYECVCCDNLWDDLIGEATHGRLEYVISTPTCMVNIPSSITPHPYCMNDKRRK